MLGGAVFVCVCAADLRCRRNLSFSEDSDLSCDDVLERSSQKSKMEVSLLQASESWPLSLRGRSHHLISMLASTSLCSNLLFLLFSIGIPISLT